MLHSAHVGDTYNISDNQCFIPVFFDLGEKSTIVGDQRQHRQRSLKLQDYPSARWHGGLLESLSDTRSGDTREP